MPPLRIAEAISSGRRRSAAHRRAVNDQATRTKPPAGGCPAPQRRAGLSAAGRGRYPTTVSASTYDAVVIGAGAAGVAAATALGEAGLRVCVVEARDRIGGRVWTVREPGLTAPVELGAEFVHGAPEEILAPTREGLYALAPTRGSSWQFRDGVLAPAAGWPRSADRIFERLYEAAAESEDRSFLDFLDRYCSDADPAARAQALAFVQGYHAAHADRIGVKGLVRGEEADEEIASDDQYRVRGGYDGVLDAMRAHWDPARITLRLNTVVAEINWEPGRVHVLTRPADARRPGFQTGSGADGRPGDAGREQDTLVARRAIVTLPLGVLKQPPDAPGAVRFMPALPEKDAALRGVEMGNVVKVILRFREPFWEVALADALAKRPPGAAGDGSTARRGRRRRGPPTMLGFLRAADEPIPTWWTQAPTPGREAPLLTGWTGGPNAERLAALPEDALREMALDSLGRIFSLARRRTEPLLDGWHYHNWQDDPFARGAYAYVGVNGLAAQEALAQPVENTLYFAGEATEWHGHFSTVHGAIMTGNRAAREVLSRRV